ncbi:MAG: MFS transporter, partial [Armatimonadetes bacterium]|nr:MFS transporter [Armatimonadota bacterium]NIO98483.1 MFS transporter [Armatimonadota bacterium]
MSLIRNSVFLAAASAHMAVDLLNGQRSILLAVLSIPLGLTNSLIGLVSSLYILSASVSQPLFGEFADRFGPRWVATGGVFWMALMFSMAVTVPGYAALLFLALAALGSAAFHPAGAMEATLLGRQRSGGRETTAASLFFLFGQGGLSIGPMVGGPILERWGPTGLLLLLFFVVPVGVNAG